MHAASSRCRRHWFAALLATAAGLGLGSPGIGRAQDVIKANNTSALNLTTSWDGGAVPGASNVAVWDSTVTGGNNSALGGSLSWQGIRIADPGGAITIGATTSATLTLGSSGIDMSQATQNLTISPNLAIGANQTWTVAGGRTLTGIAGTTTAVGTGTGNIIMSRSAVSGFDAGTATIVFNQNGNGTGWGGYSGNITVDSNVKLQSQGNAAAALGSGTLTLAGGQVAQNNGNWTLSNTIDVTAASVIGNDSGNAAAGRSLKLTGNLTSANGSSVTFTNNNGAAQWGSNLNQNAGFILAGQGISSYGDTVISANSRVRVGGNATATVAGDGFDAGTRGSLGTGAVNLAATTAELAFTRTDAHTVANDITGTGTLYVGGTTAALAGTSTQAVTLTGTNTYSGATTIAAGTLQVGNGGTAGTLGSGAVTNNGSLVFNRSNDLTAGNAISGTGSLTKTGAGTLTLSAISSLSGSVAVNAGTLLLTDNNNFSGPVTIAPGSTLRVGNGSTAGFIGNTAAVTNDGAMIWNRTNATSVGNAISGTGSVTQQGTGTLTLSGTSSYTGPTVVNGGTLSLTGALSSSTAVTLGGATFSYGGAAPQTLGGLTVAAGANTITNTNTDDTNTLALGSITRTGGVVNFSNATDTDNVVTTTSGNTNGILGPWATVAGTNWAAVDGSNRIVAYNGYTDVQRLSPGTIADDPASNVRIIEGSGTAGDILLGASDTTINTLLQSTVDGNGPATVNTASGTLRAGGVMVAASAGGLTIGTTANSGTLTAASAGGDLTLLNESINALTINATIADNVSASSLTKSGAGDLILTGTNTYGGGTSLGAGTIRVGDNAALGAGALTINGGTLRTSANANRTLANSIVLAGDGAFNSDSTGGQGMRLNGVISGSGGFNLTSASSAYVTLAGTNTFTGATTLTSGRLAITLNALKDSASVTMGDNTWLLLGVNGTTSINNLSSAATNPIIRTDFNIDSPDGQRILSINQSTDGTYAGTFQQGGNRPISLIKEGGAILTLTNSGNAYTGSTTINAGTLAIGGSGRINSGSYAGAISIATGATLHHDSSNAQTFSGTMSGAGTLLKSATGVLQLTGTNNTFAGLIDITNGDVVLNNAGSVNGAPAVNMTGGRLLLAVPFVGQVATIGNLTGTAGTINTQFGGDAGIRTLQVNQTTDGAFAGNLQDGGGSRDLGLIKTGTAALTLSGTNNTYTGGSLLSQGTLIANHGNALGTGGTVTINDTNTGANNTSLLLGSVTVGRAITVANEGTGTVTLGANGSVALPEFSGAITLNKAVVLDGSTNTDRLTFTGGIGGTGDVTIAGTGRVVFSGVANTYNGSTPINAGSILQLGTGASTATQFIPNASVVDIGTGGFLKLAKGANGETVGGLTGTGTVRGHEGVPSIASTLTVSNSGDHSFAGVLENGGASDATLSLTKSGTGTQTLSGANTYTGATTVSAGTLLVNGSIASSSLTTVASAATLGGSGTVGAALIQSGGFHAPGTSPGIQTFTNGLEYQAAATLTWELFANTTADRGTNYDGIDLTGGSLVVDPEAILALDFGTSAGGSTVDWNDPFWDGDQSWTIVSLQSPGTWNGSLFGVLSVGPDAFGQSLGDLRPNASFSVADVGGDMTLQYTAVPEPATLALAAAGLAALAAAARRRRFRMIR